MPNTTTSKNTTFFKIIFWFTIGCGTLLASVIAYRYNISTTNVNTAVDFLKIIPNTILPYLVSPIIIILGLIESSNNLKKSNKFQIKTSYLVSGILFANIVLIGTLTISSFLLNPTTNIATYFTESTLSSILISSIIPFILTLQPDGDVDVKFSFSSITLTAIISAFYFFQHLPFNTRANNEIIFHYMNVTSSISGWLLSITVSCGIVCGILILIAWIAVLVNSDTN